MDGVVSDEGSVQNQLMIRADGKRSCWQTELRNMRTRSKQELARNAHRSGASFKSPPQ